MIAPQHGHPYPLSAPLLYLRQDETPQIRGAIFANDRVKNIENRQDIAVAFNCRG